MSGSRLAPGWAIIGDVMHDPATDLVELHEAGDRLRELAFLHDIARLATLARDWDELMRTIVEGTTVAMDVQVLSLIHI